MAGTQVSRFFSSMPKTNKMASEQEGNHDSESPWCQLVCTHECRPPIAVRKETYTFGRSPACDMSFVGCKFLSGKHCFLMRDSEGKAWLHDTSTNGTLVNGNKVKAGQAVKLCHNDEIQLVHRKDLDIGFVFHDMKTSREDEETLENTQEYQLDPDSEASSKKDNSKSIENVQRTGQTGKRPYQKSASTSETESPAPKKQHTDQEKTAKNETQPSKKSQSSIAENLVCNICQDIFHDCISLQPCMHSYCASCYSQWMERSPGCPSCRIKVSRISRNHLINNLVDAFLKDNPEKRRSKEEIEEMNSKNKITSDMLKPPRPRRDGMPIFGGFMYMEYDDESDHEDEDEVLSEYDSDGSGYSEPEFDDDDDDDDDDNDINSDFSPFNRNVALPESVADLFGFLTRGTSRTSSSMCRQCPSTGQPSSTSFGSTAGGGSSTNTTSPGISAPPYTCTPSRSHILCLCCMEYMPDRRTRDVAATATPIPPQTCTICKRAFCHLYWGCGGPCRGCLNQFKDIVFEDSSLDKLIMDNTYESNVLKNYISSKGISCMELLRKCLDKLDSKEYHVRDVLNVTSSTVMCKNCGFRNFQELAYQYRRDIPRGELPDDVKDRQDCYWGKNCRTQKNRIHHAERFNHICEQKRFN